MFRRDEMQAMQAGEKAAWWGFVLLLACVVYVLVTFGNAGDKEIWLVNAHMLLHGKRLYRDIFSVSPPLIYYIYVLPIYLSEITGVLKDFQLFNAMGLALIFWSAWTGSKLLACHPAFSAAAMQRQHLLLMLIVFNTCSGAYYFFDREHIFLVLSFPYLLRFMPSLSEERYPLGMRVGIGLAAAIGFCIKPYCLILPAVVALLYVIRRRSLAIVFCVENLVIYLFTGLYLACIYLYTPEYIHIIVPMALATYGAANSRLAGLFFLAICLLIFAVTFVDFRPRYTSPYRRDIYYLLGISGGFLAYALANNGWGYTYNPLACSLLIVTGWVGWEYLYLKREHAAKGLPVKSFVFGARACAINIAANAACVTLGALMTVLLGCRAHLQCDQTGREVLESVNHAHSFGSVSLDFGIWAQLVDQTGLHWDTRFSQLWMLPKFYISDATFKEKNRWVLQYVASGFASDLNSRKPEVMFVDEANSFYSVRTHMDLLGLLNQFEDFRQAWGHYHLVRSICPAKKKHPDAPPENICKYYVYDRTD